MRRTVVVAAILFVSLCLILGAQEAAGRRIGKKIASPNEPKIVRPDNSEIHAARNVNNERDYRSAEMYDDGDDEDDGHPHADRGRAEQARMYQMFQQIISSNPKYAEIARRVRAGELSNEDPIVQSMMEEVYAQLGA